MLRVLLTLTFTTKSKITAIHHVEHHPAPLPHLAFLGKGSPDPWLQKNSLAIGDDPADHAGGSSNLDGRCDVQSRRECTQHLELALDAIVVFEPPRLE